jgi:Sulfatase
MHSRPRYRSNPWCADDSSSDASKLASKVENALLLFAACLLAIACERPPPTVLRPNILILTLDTTRADHLGAYGYFRDTSPAIDALARESIVFERAIAPMATTLPTHVSVFTATAPIEHGRLRCSPPNRVTEPRLS